MEIRGFMVIGFDGFGEANSSISLGLFQEDLVNIVCFDAMQEGLRLLDHFERKYKVTDAKKVPTAEEVARTVNLMIFCAPSSFTVDAAENTAPECNSIGTITLNNSVGEINPMAVEMSARADAQVVWFPTCDGTHEQARTFTGDSNKKLSFWDDSVMALEKAGIRAPPISPLDNAIKLLGKD